MSTMYMMRLPLTVEEFTKSTGWTWWSNDEGEGFTDGTNYVHADKNEEGKIYQFTRYGMNDAVALYEVAVAENDDEDPDYDRTWGPMMRRFRAQYLLHDEGKTLTDKERTELTRISQEEGYKPDDGEYLDTIYAREYGDEQE